MFTQYKNLFLICNIMFLLSTIITVKTCAQSYYVLTGANNGWQSYNGSYYKESYQILSRPVYKHATNTYFLFFDQTYYSDIWLIDNDTNGTTSAFFKWSSSAYPPVGKYEIDFAFGSAEPTLAKVTNALITFTDGSAFTPDIIKGSANQVFGRFQLSADETGAFLTAASIKLYGECTGLSNFKLWASADAVFNSSSDTQLGSTIAANPGDGGTASFSAFSSAIATGGTYYFHTANVAAAASGIMECKIVANANLLISGGSLSGTITNAPLSNSDISLPVELASFSASIQGNAIVLNWQTASETDNLGFILERSFENGVWTKIASYKTLNALQGQGNKSTTTKYTLTDVNITHGGDYRYRLSDVNTAGTVTMHSPISVTMMALPQSTVMMNAYPNPFNPETTVKYNLHQDTQVTITVYDLLGRTVKTLVDEQQTAGIWQVIWNGANDLDSKVAGGLYIICMETQEVTRTQKVLLLK